MGELKEQVTCSFTKQLVDKSKATHGFSIRPQIFKMIHRELPDFTKDSWISTSILKEYKLRYVEGMLGDTALAKVIRDHEMLSDDYARSLEETDTSTWLTKIGDFASSHKFGLTLLTLVAGWIIVNHWVSFDTYPYNLLDLVLGLIASLQALFIMISQEESDKKDKQRMLNTLRLSLKNELEMSILREKVDHIIHVQNAHLYQELRDIKKEIKGQ